MGIGGAFIMPATLSIITNVFPGARSAAARSASGPASPALGVALGPVTGGFLLEHFYWGSIFLVNLPIVVVALVAGVLPHADVEGPDRAAARPRRAPCSRSSGLVALVYAIIEAPTKGWSDPTILGALGLGGGRCSVAFFVWELHSTHPMLDLHFFKNPRFTRRERRASRSCSSRCSASIFLLTQYLQFVLGYIAARSRRPAAAARADDDGRGAARARGSWSGSARRSSSSTRAVSLAGLGVLSFARARGVDGLRAHRLASWC